MINLFFIDLYVLVFIVMLSLIDIVDIFFGINIVKRVFFL